MAEDFIAVVDYGAGNTHNVLRALNALGEDALLTSSADELRAARGLVLPGVGAFASAMAELEERGLIKEIRSLVAAGKPLLGVCLGMQILLDSSTEHGATAGFGFIPGTCEHIPAKPNFPVPHMGWNELQVTSPDALTQGIDGEYVYFVHSYFADVPQEYLRATASYSQPIPAMISKDNVFGVQFHPEKSGDAGHRILRNFKEYVYANSPSN